MVVQQKLLEKAYFIIKPTGRAMVRPASSDKWKAPLDSGFHKHKFPGFRNPNHLTRGGYFVKENWKRDSYVSLIRKPKFTATQTDWLKGTEKKNI